MSHMERLSNVRGRKFDNNLLATLRWISWIFQTRVCALSKLAISGEDRGDEDFCELVGLEEKLKKRSFYCWLFDKRGFREL